MKRSFTNKSLPALALLSCLGTVSVTTPARAAATLDHLDADVAADTDFWDTQYFMAGYVTYAQYLGSQSTSGGTVHRTVSVDQLLGVYTRVFSKSSILFRVMAEGDAEGIRPKTGSSTIDEEASLEVEVDDDVVYDKTKSSNCNQEGYESCVDYENSFTKDFYSKNGDVPLGPFTITVGGTVSGTATVNAKGRARVESFTWSKGYYGRAKASYSGSVSADLKLRASLGATITAKLRLIRLAIEPVAKYDQDYNAADTCVTRTWANKADLTISSMNGQVDLSLAGYHRTIAEWPGWSTTKPLSHKEDSLKVCL